ncbi:hypothetical protein KSP40_PGU003243 [Platanthera guangdongensis]|uniref:Uncharacterized protein n=1 Tax=Platanthera guangdongensis TaxID=2320717 RepID=A0ABR2MG82_9ASPA
MDAFEVFVGGGLHPCAMQTRCNRLPSTRLERKTAGIRSIQLEMVHPQQAPDVARSAGHQEGDEGASPANRRRRPFLADGKLG